ncbi:hypothetical protein O6H91_20G043600 [Diphasiastrum complanatum]|uniref:Uncharacterized protein n=1 Tax=Diphasiastrum complanatum TaxID=34168 RepID=A0ACC2APS7_DIPCM|nr:hypothetical protein O6H91_20G043600 [Diphasiastrum complanatum]
MQGPICAESFFSMHNHLPDKDSSLPNLGDFDISMSFQRSNEFEGEDIAVGVDEYEVPKTSRSSYRCQLEDDVLELQKNLQNEVDLNAALKTALGLASGSLECCPKSLPTHAEELLAEIAQLEVDISNLEEQIIALRLQIGHEQTKQINLEEQGSQSPSKLENQSNELYSWNPLADLETTECSSATASQFDLRELTASPVTPKHFLQPSSTPLSAKHEHELRALLSSIVPSEFDMPLSPGAPRKNSQARSLFLSPERDLADCLSAGELCGPVGPPSPPVVSKKVQPSSSFLSAEHELRECLSSLVSPGTDINDIPTSPVRLRNNAQPTSPIASNERPLLYPGSPEHVRMQAGRRPPADDFSPSKSSFATRFSKHSSFDSYKDLLFRSSSGSRVLTSSSMSADSLPFPSPSTPESGIFISSKKKLGTSSPGDAANEDLLSSPSSPEHFTLQQSIELSNLIQNQRQGSSWSCTAEDPFSSQSSSFPSPKYDHQTSLLQHKMPTSEEQQQSSAYKTVVLKIREHRKLYRTAFFAKSRDQGSKKLRDVKADKLHSESNRSLSSTSSKTKQCLSQPLSPRDGQASEENISNRRDCLLEPNKLSEEMVLCMMDIYRDLTEPKSTHSKGMSLDEFFSSTPSKGQEKSQVPDNSEPLVFSSSPSIILHDTDKTMGTDTTFDPYKTPEKLPWADIGRYSKAEEILGISVGKKKLDYAAEALQRYRLLLKQLSEVDPRCMTHAEKLAFWINLYNALVMHAYLAYGVPKSVLKFVSAIQKASYNVGGYSLNAFSIEYAMLRGKVTTRRPQLLGCCDDLDMCMTGLDVGSP